VDSTVSLLMQAAEAPPLTLPLAHCLRQLRTRIQFGLSTNTQRSSAISLLHWASLCAGAVATPEESQHVVALIGGQLCRMNAGLCANSAELQNWYLTTSNGQMSPLRRSVITRCPKRSVHSGGARNPEISRQPAREPDPARVHDLRGTKNNG